MYVVAITGASGAILGIRLAEELLKSGKEVYAVGSDSGLKTMSFELFRERSRVISIRECLEKRGVQARPDQFREFDNGDFFSPLASGTFPFRGMVIAPTSMKTLSAVATGNANTLINRAADVALKEDRRLILVPRETPLGLVHLENMLRAKRAGADILPPVPGFYTFPRTIDEVVDFVVGRVLSLLGIEHGLYRGWGEGPGSAG